MRTSLYNMMSNSWRTINLVSSELQPVYRFGACLVPIFSKDVVIRDQMDMV